ncbi:FGGY family carbohydrate kinase [Ornithinicoccus hortensis]|uniref:Xylulokinase n=1 Tax=Ornithinicoccus hortensis TaxID=82346 RepID=A0A542YUR8_9MICO|nr:FGGY family carbohydrate kinase [Ornithinicoccus hortensis]TQL51826.1 xylulokinase [Ornithinicoccus hortensis]
MTGSYLGLDLGTSGLKAALWSPEGELQAVAEADYPVEHPAPGWAQTPVQRWRDALESVSQQLAPTLRRIPVAGIGVDGQMHGLVLADRHGTALAPAALWSDSRAAEVLERWHRLPGSVQARLANPVVPGMTGPLLAWTDEHQPELLATAEVALLPKDAFRSLLVPSVVTDRSDASATLLWDVPGDRWVDEVEEQLGIPARLLPAVVPSDAVVGTTDWLRETVGGTGDVPVVAGAADAPAARLALGDRVGLQINLGSGGQVLLPTGPPGPVPHAVTHTYADARGGWYRMAAVQNAGTALDWVCRVLALSWADLFALAEQAPAGAGGVSFLPFLQGERGDTVPPSVGAGWVGATDTATRGDLARAAVEGMVFNLRRAVELLPEADRAGDGAPVVLTGGGGRAPLVRQLLADVLDLPVLRQDLRSASATGAALLAALGTGAGFEPQRGAPVVVETSAQAVETVAAYDVWTDRLAQLAARESRG